MTDDFGDRMKTYEAHHELSLHGDEPFVVRIDGRCFSKFTKGMTRPFDGFMTRAMQDVTAALVEKTHAQMGYTQSDEITLIYEPNEYGDMFFGGRVVKIASVLASMAASEFAWDCLYKEKVMKTRPHFDARVFGVPSRMEAANALLWRAQDCRKNAVQSIARANFSHRQLQGKSQVDMLAMLANQGITLDDYPRQNIYGTYVQRRSRLRDAPSGQTCLRTKVEQIDIGYFGDVKNRVGVIFEREEPQYG